MANKKVGSQTIGCNVTSCRFHDCDGHYCDLSDITVEPMCGCNTGDPCDESMCGSYEHK